MQYARFLYESLVIKMQKTIATYIKQAKINYYASKARIASTVSASTFLNSSIAGSTPA